MIGVGSTIADEVGEDVGLDSTGIGPKPGIHSHVHFPVFSSSTGRFSDIHIILEHAGGVIAFVGAGGGEVTGYVSSARAWIGDGSRPGMYLQLQLLVV